MEARGTYSSGNPDIRGNLKLFSFHYETVMLRELVKFQDKRELVKLRK